MSLTGFLFTLVFLGLCVAALVRHPIYGLFAYLASFYIHPPSRWWGQDWPVDIRWAFIAAGVTLIAIWIHQSNFDKKSFFKFPIVWLFIALTLWAGIQSAWALWPEKHAEFVGMYAKFILAAYLIYRSVDSEKHLRWFLWGHVIGCFCLAWIARAGFSGGRFDSFGGPGISDANSAANQLVTGIVVAAALFLMSRVKGKTGIVVLMPLILDALVMTGSRSGFLGFLAAGTVFNRFTPKPSRRFVLVLSLLGVVLLAMLAGPKYWERMSTIREAGTKMEGVDTGATRLEIIAAQWQMFGRYPLGCGHRCTAFLSHEYLNEDAFSDLEEGAGRSSHNTFMTLLVEQGIVGAAFYVLLLGWCFVRLRQLFREAYEIDSVASHALPAVAASLTAIFVGDMFVDLLKHEVRIWMIALVLVLGQLIVKKNSSESSGP